MIPKDLLLSFNQSISTLTALQPLRRTDSLEEMRKVTQIVENQGNQLRSICRQLSQVVM